MARRAEAARAKARASIAAVLRRSGVEAESALQPLGERLREHARVTLSFHPDRRLYDGLTIAEKLLREGRYRSQFETGVSSGSRTAFAGGDRDTWENHLFGGAYHEFGVRPDERPKYGALNVMDHADGGSPRFGSCYFVLRRHITPHCSFTWGDSHEGPEHVGTVEVLDALLAALLETSETTGEALGTPGMDVGSLLRFAASLERRAPSQRAVGRALDTYIEAQVHADVELACDAEALVIDPAFEGTATGDRLHELCERNGIAIESHPGFALDAVEIAARVPDDFRGPRMGPLASRVVRCFGAGGGTLDAVVIGRAADSLHHEPDVWQDWGTPEETLQHLKKLWHVLVRYGRARSERPKGADHLSVR